MASRRGRLSGPPAFPSPAFRLRTTPHDDANRFFPLGVGKGIEGLVDVAQREEMRGERIEVDPAAGDQGDHVLPHAGRFVTRPQLEILNQKTAHHKGLALGSQPRHYDDAAGSDHLDGIVEQSGLAGGDDDAIDAEAPGQVAYLLCIPLGPRIDGDVGAELFRLFEPELHHVGDDQLCRLVQPDTLGGHQPDRSHSEDGHLLHKLNPGLLDR